MPERDSFESRIPLAQLPMLLDLGLEYGFDPTSSSEMEDYCLSVLARHEQDPGMASALRNSFAQSFRCLNAPPRWIQNPDWQVNDSGPMCFVGQIDCAPREGLFHDDASFYVFMDFASGERRVIMQIA